MTGGAVDGAANGPIDEIEFVLNRLNASSLTALARDAVVDALAVGTSTAAERRSAGGRSGDDAAVFLSSLRVNGFRGIGHEVQVEFEPAPGLTVVSGRNGSGKSSIAESMDVLLTGSSDRWRGRNVTWRDAWQHLSGIDTAITAKFVVAGVPGGVVLEHRTKAGVKPDDAPPVSVSWPGSSAKTLLACGWAESVRQFRPFLSYNELGGLIEGTGADRYKALSAVLDLGHLEQAVGDLATRRSTLDKERKDLETRRKSLAAEALAAAKDHPRAAALAKALSAKPVVMAAVDVALDEQSDAVSPEAAQPANAALVISRMRTDDLRRVPELLAQLTSARDYRLRVGSADVQESLHLAELLQAALRHFQHLQRGGVDGESCPLCGVGTLNKEWAAAAEHRQVQLRATAQELTQAQAELEQCVASLDRAVGSVRVHAVPLQAFASEPTTPQALHSSLVLAATAVKVIAQVEISLSALDSDAIDGINGIGAIALEAADRLDDLVASARTVLSTQASVWTPIRNEVLVWRAELGDPGQRAETLEAVKAAEVWLAEQTARIRSDRFAPLQQQASSIWSRLRRDSNVELAAITLDKKGKSGSVDVAVDVDGEHRAGLGVLSQGEIHAMALSLFLPRAGVAQSPFRFLIIDDPVQAMDPAKVEALALVLADEAKTRQIIVFTHDERFAQAVDRLQLKAKLYNVTRDRAGRMTVEPSHGPTSRSLRDASAMLKSGGVPPEVMSRVVPNLCRQAIESACDGVLRRRWMTGGSGHEAAEERLLGATKLNHRLAMVLFDDAERTADVGDRLKQENPLFAAVVSEANRGSHGTGTKSLAALESHRDGTRLLCKWIEQQR